MFSPLENGFPLSPDPISPFRYGPRKFAPEKMHSTQSTQQILRFAFHSPHNLTVTNKVCCCCFVVVSLTNAQWLLNAFITPTTNPVVGIINACSQSWDDFHATSCLLCLLWLCRCCCLCRVRCEVLFSENQKEEPSDWLLWLPSNFLRDCSILFCLENRAYFLEEGKKNHPFVWDKRKASRDKHEIIRTLFRGVLR
jgi:hypothetical protein